MNGSVFHLEELQQSARPHNSSLNASVAQPIGGPVDTLLEGAFLARILEPQ
jgi:hypothetical protein